VNINDTVEIKLLVSPGPKTMLGLGHGVVAALSGNTLLIATVSSTSLCSIGSQ